MSPAAAPAHLPSPAGSASSYLPMLTGRFPSTSAAGTAPSVLGLTSLRIEQQYHSHQPACEPVPAEHAACPPSVLGLGFAADSPAGGADHAPAWVDDDVRFSSAILLGLARGRGSHSSADVGSSANGSSSSSGAGSDSLSDESDEDDDDHAGFVCATSSVQEVSPRPPLRPSEKHC